MAGFSRPISLWFHLLAAAQGVDRSGHHRKGVAATAQTNGSAKAAALGTGDGGWNLFACKKRGADVGKTKRGKGSKIMVMVDGKGIPISAFVTSAQVAEVNTIETLVDVRQCGDEIRRLIDDRAADADWLRDALEHRHIELVCPHRRGRKRPGRQDGRKLRRYRHRWIVERSISWLFNYRRLIVRHERHSHLFEGFVTLACCLIVLNRF